MKDDNGIDFSQFNTEAEEAQVSSDMLRELTRSCQEERSIKNRIEELEAELKAAKAKHRIMVEREIPEMMLDIGLMQIALEDGTEIKVDDIICARISEARRPAAHQWLRDNGYGDLIKNVVEARFAAGEDQQATDLLHQLIDSGFSVDQKESIHYQTLQAQVRRWAADGTQFPEEVFGVYRGKVAVIK